MEVKKTLAECGNTTARVMVSLIHDSNLKFFDMSSSVPPSERELLAARYSQFPPDIFFNADTPFFLSTGFTMRIATPSQDTYMFIR